MSEEVRKFLTIEKTDCPSTYPFSVLFLIAGNALDRTLLKDRQESRERSLDPDYVVSCGQAAVIAVCYQYIDALSMVTTGGKFCMSC